MSGRSWQRGTEVIDQIREAGGSSDAAPAVHLASDEAAFVHGTIIDVDGARTTVAVIAGA